MNPYIFVTPVWDQSPVRQPYQPHNRFNGLQGELEFRLTLLTPAFIPSNLVRQPRQFLRNGQGQYIIPGSLLKGLIRSLVETVGPGCWSMFEGSYEKNTVDYTNKLPDEYRKCTDINQLCPACRLFGWMSGSQNGVLAGKVRFNDAVAEKVVTHGAVYTKVLSNPKPHHKAWYLDPDEQKVAGRKYYFHQSDIQTATDWILSRAPANRRLNQYICPLGSGSIFHSTLTFFNLTEEEEWPLLLYAMFLEDTMAHKLGYAKPLGFGSVKIEPVKLRLINLVNRYSFEERENVSEEEGKIFEEARLVQYLQKKTARYREDEESIVLNQLRQVWAWPPVLQNYAYPSRDWFNDNSQAPITATITAT